jgi:hypothetical protein
MNYRSPNPPPNSLTFGNSTCSWCFSDNDVLATTEYGTARSAQIFFGNLNNQNASSHVVAWAYWGNVRQVNWTEPLINKVWGNLNHGIYWLAWNFPCAATVPIGYPAYYACNNPPSLNPTNEVWPTHVGMVYLKLANGDQTFKPSGAPSWWSASLPVLSRPPLPSFPPVPSARPSPSPSPTPTPRPGDLNGDGYVNRADIDYYLSTGNTNIYDYNLVVANYNQ